MLLVAFAFWAKLELGAMTAAASATVEAIARERFMTQGYWISAADTGVDETQLHCP
jgi:hypothetical protein